MDADTATVDAWTSGRLDHVDVTARACPRTRRRHTAAIFMPRMNGSAFLLFTAPFRARRLEKSCSLSCLCREEGFQVHGKPFSLRRPFFTARDRIVGRSLHGIRNGLSAMDERASPSALAMAVRNVARGPSFVRPRHGTGCGTRPANGALHFNRRSSRHTPMLSCQRALTHREIPSVASSATLKDYGKELARPGTLKQ